MWARQIASPAPSQENVRRKNCQKRDKERGGVANVLNYVIILMLTECILIESFSFSAMSFWEVY